MMQSCWNKEPCRRPTFKDTHKFFEELAIPVFKMITLDLGVQFILDAMINASQCPLCPLIVNTGLMEYYFEIIVQYYIEINWMIFEIFDW